MPFNKTEYNKTYYQQHKEYYKNAKKDYIANNTAHFKEYEKNYNREYYLKNKEKILQRQKERLEEKKKNKN